MKRCPYCAEEIQDEAIKCKHCGERFNSDTMDTLDGAETLLDRNSTPKTDQIDSLGEKPTVVNSRVNEQKTSFFSSETQGTAGTSKYFESRYDILEQIGEGGMGVVYKAKDCRLGRVVAIKRLQSNAVGNQKAIQRFLSEAQSIARLNHYNIVHIYDIAEDEHGPYISMEFVEGKTLAQIINSDGALSEEKALGIFEQIISAVGYAHKEEIIHRDIKPGNIMIDTNGVPKLMDFGLAKIHNKQQMTIAGAMMGTPDYASPEQLRDSKDIDGRTDIYSIDATMYECLTGVSPRHFRESQIPQQYRQLILNAMERDRKKRYRSIEEFLVEFKTYCSEEVGNRKLIAKIEKNNITQHPFEPANTKYNKEELELKHLELKEKRLALKELQSKRNRDKIKAGWKFVKVIFKLVFILVVLLLILTFLGEISF